MSMLLPTSSVNTMSSDNDRCFQCQEVGHMACYCPHICCYDCDNYGHVAMDCPDKIPSSGTPSCHRTNNRDRNRRSSSRRPSHTRRSHHDHRDRSRFSLLLLPSLTITVIKAGADMSTAGTTQDSPIDISITVPCTIEAPAHITIVETSPHTRPSHHNTSRDNSRSRHNTKYCHYKPALGSASTTQASTQKYEDKRHKPKQVSIDDPLSDYYSSEESESDSEDDLN